MPPPRREFRSLTPVGWALLSTAVATVLGLASHDACVPHVLRWSTTRNLPTPSALKREHPAMRAMPLASRHFVCKSWIYSPTTSRITFCQRLQPLGQETNLPPDDAQTMNHTSKSRSDAERTRSVSAVRPRCSLNDAWGTDCSDMLFTRCCKSSRTFRFFA